MKFVYAYEDGIKFSKCNDTLIATKENITQMREPIRNLKAILLFGYEQISTQAIRFCLENQIELFYCLKSGKIIGYLHAFTSSSCTLRMRQYLYYHNTKIRVELSKTLIKGKTDGQIALIKSKRKKGLETRKNISSMIGLQEKLQDCNTIEQIMGIEGRVAVIYFKEYGKLIGHKKLIRSRPAHDFVNALLNLTYALVTTQIISVLVPYGLDISLGFLHSTKGNRPSLALDAIELFRPTCDRFVLTLIRRKEISEKDFDTLVENQYQLKPKSFHKYIEKYADSLDLSEEINNAIKKYFCKIINREEDNHR